jgi:two-component system phosphate regulon response regulator PhoB
MLGTSTNKQILIVDRNLAAVEPLRQKLTDAGFAVSAITDGPAAVMAVVERPPHLVIVDWNMPGFAALEVIQVVRGTRRPQPVRLIILSDVSAEQDVVAGLNLGADDYIVKPFSLREVVARVAAVLRSRQNDAHRAALNCGELVLDVSTNRVTAHGRLLNLRGVEYRLLKFLMSNPGRIFNRTQLLAQLWGDDSEVDERTVDVKCSDCARLSLDQGMRHTFRRFAASAIGFPTRQRPRGGTKIGDLRHISRVPRDVPRLSTFL